VSLVECKASGGTSCFVKELGADEGRLGVTQEQRRLDQRRKVDERLAGERQRGYTPTGEAVWVAGNAEQREPQPRPHEQVPGWSRSVVEFLQRFGRSAVVTCERVR
jgi:hypothetical protein